MDHFYKSKIIELSGAPSEVQELNQYWQNKCQSDGVPLKKDIMPWELPKQLGRICIIEVTQDPLDFIYRVDGTNTSVSATSDLRNASILDGEPADIYKAMYADLAKSAQLCEPVLWETKYNHDEFSCYYLRLVLPLKKDVAGDYLMTFSYNLESADGIFERPLHKA